MPGLSAHLNVFNTALVVLKNKGFNLTYDQKNDWWKAEKDGWDFLADNPMELLGLVAIHEYHKPKEKRDYWWKIDKPDLLSELDPENG